MTRTIITFTTLIFLALGLLAGAVVLPVAAQTAATNSASADDFIPEIPIPGLFEGAQPMDSNNNLMANYIRALFVYFVWVVGIIATVMVVYGGIKWVGAAGNPGQIKDARDIIDSAVIGVIIALTSVVLLNIINPKLTSLNITGINPVNKKDYLGLAASKICGAELKITCGSFNKIGTVKVDGKDVDDYCIGTICDPADNARRVCTLSKVGETGEISQGGGCVKEVPISNPTGEFSALTTLSINNNVVVGFGCGLIDYFPGVDKPYSVHWMCSNGGTAGSCYMLGSGANIKDTSTIDTVTNFCCPGKPCPQN